MIAIKKAGLDLRLNLTILRIWGLWPGTDWSPLQMAAYRCQTTFSLSMLTVLVMSQIAALFEKGNSLETHLANACLLIEFIIAIIKFVIFLRKRIPLVQLIDKLSEMHLRHGKHVPEQVEILRSTSLRGSLTTATFLIMGFCTCMTWLFYPFIFSALPDKNCSLKSGDHTIEQLRIGVNPSVEHFRELSTSDKYSLLNYNFSSQPDQVASKISIKSINKTNYLAKTKIIAEDTREFLKTIRESPEINDDLQSNNVGNNNIFEGTRNDSNESPELPPLKNSEVCSSPRELPAIAWFPFDRTEDTGYKIAYIFQVISIYIGYITTSCMDTFFVSIFIYITAQLKILNISIKNVRKWILEEETYDKNSIVTVGRLSWFDKNSNMDWAALNSRIPVTHDVEEKIGDALVKCIKHHQEIISSVSELQDIISISLLCQVVTSMCVICLTLFSVAVGSNDFAASLKYGTYLCTMFAQLFLYCWFGDELLVESLEVYHSAYSCGWPDGSRFFKQRILMLILRAQRPLAITAGKYYVMSRRTYLQIVQGSYSVFTVLRNVNDEEGAQHRHHRE